LQVYDAGPVVGQAMHRPVVGQSMHRPVVGQSKPATNSFKL
jgi:hypothetical protein